MLSQQGLFFSGKETALDSPDAVPHQTAVRGSGLCTRACYTRRKQPAASEVSNAVIKTLVQQLYRIIPTLLKLFNNSEL